MYKPKKRHVFPNTQPVVLLCAEAYFDKVQKVARFHLEVHTIAAWWIQEKVLTRDHPGFGCRPIVAGACDADFANPIGLLNTQTMLVTFGGFTYPLNTWLNDCRADFAKQAAELELIFKDDRDYPYAKHG